MIDPKKHTKFLIRLSIFICVLLINKVFSQKNIFCPEIETFSTVGFHSTNFDSSSYKHFAPWIEVRGFFSWLEADSGLGYASLYPFGIATTGDCGSLAENKFIGGIGLHLYPFFGFPKNWRSKFKWLKSIRTFADHSWLSYYNECKEKLKKDEELSKSLPRKDLRIGIDLWYESGVPDIPKDQKNETKKHTSCFWGEIWIQWAYHTTNFQSKNYKTSLFASVGRVGIKIPTDRSNRFLYPYLLAELSLSGKRNYWENRGIWGVGFRLFHIKNWEKKLNRLSFFIEGRCAIGHVKDKPDSLIAWDYLQSSFPKRIPGKNKPKFDIHFGINFSLGGWWNANTQRGSVNKETPKGK